jgi:hypothetical protein
MTEPHRIRITEPVEIVSLKPARPDRELGLAMVAITGRKASLVVLDSDGDIAREFEGTGGTTGRDGGEIVLRALNTLKDDKEADSKSDEYEIDDHGYLTYSRDTGTVYYEHSCGESAAFEDLNGLIACVQLARLCAPVTYERLEAYSLSISTAINDSF